MAGRLQRRFFYFNSWPDCFGRDILMLTLSNFRIRRIELHSLKVTLYLSLAWIRAADV